MRAIAERLSRITASEPAERRAAMQAFFDRVSRMPVLDSRSADEIMGYDRNGLPH
jgi:hypothetical protein